MNIIRIILGLVAPEAELLLNLAKALKLKPSQIAGIATKKPKALIARIEKLNPARKKLFSEIIEGVVTGTDNVAEKLGLTSSGGTSAGRGASGGTKKGSSVVGDKLGELGQGGRKEFSDFVNQEAKVDETKTLSSSWIRKGRYVSVGVGGSGELTIWTKKGKSYTYPGVSRTVWRAMKNARGKNGSGAGSVFWALYLRAFRSSYTGQLLSKLGKLTGIKTPESNIGNLRK